MSIRSYEREILEELKEVTGNRKLRIKDMMEWRTSEVKPHDGEMVFHLRKNSVWVAIKK